MFQRIKDDMIERLRDFDFKLFHSTDIYELANMLRPFREDLDNLQARIDRLVREIERGE